VLWGFDSLHHRFLAVVHTCRAGVLRGEFSDRCVGFASILVARARESAHSRNPRAAPVHLYSVHSVGNLDVGGRGSRVNGSYALLLFDDDSIFLLDVFSAPAVFFQDQGRKVVWRPDCRRSPDSRSARMHTSWILSPGPWTT